MDWISPSPPVEIDRTMLFQGWRDAVFLHWPCDPARLHRFVPEGFSVDTFEDQAWISIVSFHMWLRVGALPPLPGIRTAIETHLRTYVTAPDGTRGIWFLSLDMDPLAGALGGRFLFFLPYWWGSQEVRRSDRRIGYAVSRRIGRTAGHRVEVEVGEPIDGAALTDRDHFLTARWALFMRYGRVPMAVEVWHAPWTFRRVSLSRLEEGLTGAVGLPHPHGTPLVHFSSGLDARIAFPRRVRGGNPAML